MRRSRPRAVPGFAGQVLSGADGRAQGLYKVECFVEGHDDMGMEALLEVSEDAPLVEEKVKSPTGNEVALTGFAFEPETIEVDAGTEVTWTNEDPADPTVTADDRSFSSNTLAAGDTFSFTFDRAGTFSYFCAIHPSMKGQITVE